MRRIGIVGLGLVASGRRNILSGDNYDHLYSRAELIGTNPIIGGEWCDTYDTLESMGEIVRVSLNDTKKVAPTLKGSTLEATVKNIWNHVYKHFQYRQDAKGIEQIRRPAVSWVDRKKGIDCDCMTVVISSILHHLSINHAYRKATYDEETGWQHVYIVVPKPGISINSFEGTKSVPRGNYYVLDCVVDRYDYEVPYIRKFDKIMKIQYLNGVDFSALRGGVTPALYQEQGEDTINGLLGLGCEFNTLHGVGDTEVAPVFMAMLKQHLINTRKLLASNPSLTDGIYDPKLFAQRLDYLIASFDEPVQREKALSELSLLEEGEERNGLSGHGLGKSFFKKVAQGIKKVTTAPIELTKKITQKTIDVTKKVAKKTLDVAKKVGKALVRFNPATIAIRNGLLLAMKLNLFRIAEKLGYGYWTEEEAKAKGLDPDEFKKAQSTLSKVQKIHKGMGGKLDKLEKAIKAGWNHGVKKHNLVHGLNGRGSKNARVVQPREGKVISRGKRGATKSHAQQQKLQTAKKQATTRVRSTLPLLELVNAQLAPVQYQSILRRQDNNDLDTFFQAVRTNKNGIATKLSLAYKPVQEASRYDRNEYAKLLSKAKATEALIIKRGGTAQQLRDAIEAGKQVAISSSGVGFVVAGSTAAASSVLAVIGKLLKAVNFVKMFKGKASSPDADENEIKTTDVTADLDEDSQDEGDPDATVVPFKNLVDSVAPELTASTTTNQASSFAAQGAAANPASKLIDDSAAVVKQAIAKKSNAISRMNTAYTTPGIVADATPDYQDAQVVSTKVNEPEKKDNTVKYIAIAGGIGVLGIGAWLLSKSANKAQQVVAPAPIPAPTQPMSGITTGRKTKTKSSSRTHKKVMTITV